MGVSKTGSNAKYLYSFNGFDSRASGTLKLRVFAAFGLGDVVCRR